MKSAATMEGIYRQFPFENRRRGVLKLRKACGLGQCELARAAKVSQTTISRFETGAQDMNKAGFARVQAVLIRALIAHEAEVRRVKARNLVPKSYLLGGSEGLQTYRDALQATSKLFGSPERAAQLLEVGAAWKLLDKGHLGRRTKKCLN